MSPIVNAIKNVVGLPYSSRKIIELGGIMYTATFDWIDDETKNKIAAFESKNKQLKISYGGDGSVLWNWRSVHAKKKILFPIRNYAQCDEHKTMLDDLLNNPSKFDSYEKELKMTLHPILDCRFQDSKKTAMSEYTIINKDATSAIRFDLNVNGIEYYNNVIATGIIVSTVFGSTGYFSSVSRTNFTSGIGIAFIAPTVGINNLILKQTDKIEMVFKRYTDIVMTADKEQFDIHVDVNDRIAFEDGCDNMAIIGRKQFMCADCRKNRNSTILSNGYLTV